MKGKGREVKVEYPYKDWQDWQDWQDDYKFCFINFCNEIFFCCMVFQIFLAIIIHFNDYMLIKLFKALL